MRRGVVATRRLLGLTAIALLVALIWVGPAAAQAIQTAGLVPPPDRPKGPSAGMVGEKLKCSTKGTDPFDVHEYMFDWGDGSAL